MIDGSEKCYGWLNLECQSPHVTESIAMLKGTVTFSIISRQ